MNLLDQKENELTEILNTVSGKLISDLQEQNLKLIKENAKLKLSLSNCKNVLVEKEALSLKFCIMQDIVERMTAIRIHRITLPYERKEIDDDEPKGVRLEISQTMLSTHVDERNVIDYSLYLPGSDSYTFLDVNDSIPSDKESDESQQNNSQISLLSTEKENKTSDVIYVPCLQQRHFKDIEHLRKLLPDLFFDMFGIHHNKLSLFYESLQKYLTKDIT
ncbi:hypothetical protein QEN19_000944 [Hanseniaspora menglaensis]